MFDGLSCITFVPAFLLLMTAFDRSSFLFSLEKPWLELDSVSTLCSAYFLRASYLESSAFSLELDPTSKFRSSILCEFCLLLVPYLIILHVCTSVSSNSTGSWLRSFLHSLLHRSSSFCSLLLCLVWAACPSLFSLSAAEALMTVQRYSRIVVASFKWALKAVVDNHHKETLILCISRQIKDLLSRSNDLWFRCLCNLYLMQAKGGVSLESQHYLRKYRSYSFLYILTLVYSRSWISFQVSPPYKVIIMVCRFLWCGFWDTEFGYSTVFIFHSSMFWV